MPGQRAKDDPKNIEGTGFYYGDPVTVDYKGEAKTNGRVEAIHGKHEENKIDVRIDHEGHKEHNRVVTFAIEKVTALPLPEAAIKVPQVATLDQHTALSARVSALEVKAKAAQ